MYQARLARICALTNITVGAVMVMHGAYWGAGVAPIVLGVLNWVRNLLPPTKRNNIFP